MRVGIGIDTGGTYTDAVMYDFELQGDSVFRKSSNHKRGHFPG